LNYYEILLLLKKGWGWGVKAVQWWGTVSKRF